MSKLIYTHKNADLSPDGVYRYALERRWREGPPLVWLMLNPSTADANDNDATLNRITGMSEGFGYGALVVVNLFAIRTKSPAELYGWAKQAKDIVGPRNNEYLRTVFAHATTIVAAWGSPEWVVPRVLEIHKLRGDKPLHRLQSVWETDGRAQKPAAPYHPLARVAFTKTLVPPEVWR